MKLHLVDSWNGRCVAPNTLSYPFGKVEYFNWFGPRPDDRNLGTGVEPGCLSPWGYNDDGAMMCFCGRGKQRKDLILASSYMATSPKKSNIESIGNLFEVVLRRTFGTRAKLRVKQVSTL